MSDPQHHHAVQRLTTALARGKALEQSATDGIAAIPMVVRDIAVGTYLVREGQKPIRCAFLLDGYIYRQKLTVEGSRSIVSIQIPGDFIDLPNLFLPESDHDIVALTRARIAEFPIESLRRLAAQYPAINHALWQASLVESSIFREWLLNVGRRNARSRAAHLLCEISARLEQSGVAREHTYEFPMTQEQLGDTLGLTAVHVNRILKGLEQDMLIRRRKRELAIIDWAGLRSAADFNERYLHVGLYEHAVAAMHPVGP